MSLFHTCFFMPAFRPACMSTCALFEDELNALGLIKRSFYHAGLFEPAGYALASFSFCGRVDFDSPSKHMIIVWSRIEPFPPGASGWFLTQKR